MSRGDTVTRKSTLARPKAKKRSKKKPEKLLEVCNACSVLAVDGADLSGWSIWQRGVLRDWGECDVFGDEPQEIIARFMQEVEGPHVLVIERPFMMRFGRGAASLGTGAKVWAKKAERAKLKRIVRVYPSTWRSPTLPKGMASAKREVVRPEEQKAAKEIALRLYGYAGPLKKPIGAESAPAILIGLWGSFSPAVLRVLPKPKPEKTFPATRVKFGRFRLSGKAAKRIERATGGIQHGSGTWLVIDGQVAMRDQRVTQDELDRAQVRLAWINLDPKHPLHFKGEQCSQAPHHVHVPLGASTAEIHSGWGWIATLVEGDYASPTVISKPARKRKGAARAA